MILMHDVPRSLVESGSSDKAGVEIVPQASNRQDEVTQLTLARDRMLARLAEINETLGAASSRDFVCSKSQQQSTTSGERTAPCSHWP